MSLSSQQYANLAGDSYKFRKEGEQFTSEGVTYRVLDNLDNRYNGYQGTVYQRVDTGEIVVAHRGTEPEHWFMDGVITDGAMVLTRANLQAGDAIELTRRAIQYAKQSASEYGDRPLQVTVAGHSLGGCHAQLTAYKFGLKGETFNAYGAVSLDQEVHEGGSNVINHVMAGDPISSASRHYGEVRVYAVPDEIRSLKEAGYDNTRNSLEYRNLASAAKLMADSHSMHMFLNVDGDNRPDTSILTDPNAMRLAEEFDPMIDKYRNDVATVRGVATIIARGPYGTLQDGIGALRSSEPPGELIRRQDRLDSALSWEESRGVADVHQLLPSRKPPYRPEVAEPGGGVSLPGYLLRSGEQDRPPLKHDEAPRYKGMPLSGITPDHPDYALYAELKQALPAAVSEDRLAQIAVAAKMGGVRAGQLDGIHIDEQSMQAFVSGKVPGNRCCVDLATPPPSVQETLQRSEIFDQQQAQQFAHFQMQQQNISTQAQAGPRMT